MKNLLKRLGLIALFMLSVLLIINIVPAKNVIPLNTFRKDGKNLIVATQSGISTDYPANIAASYNTASSLGIMYFSVGVVMTSDDVLIIADYDDLSYYTSEAGKISEHTYDEIKALNFAYNFQDASGAYTYRTSSLPCLTITDFLALFPYSNFIINVAQDGETGRRAAALLCEELRQNNLYLRVVIKGSQEAVNYARTQDNVSVLTAPIGNEFNSFVNADKFFLSNLYFSLPFQYVEINYDDIQSTTKRLIWTLHKRNVAVFIAGVDTKEEFEIATHINADGIITNDPVLINELIATQTDSQTNTE